MRPRSLRALMTIYVLLFLTGLVALRIFNYVETHKALVKEVDRRLAGEATAIVGEGSDAGRQAMIQRIAFAQGDHDTADLYFMLVDKSGHRLAGKLWLPVLPPPGYSDFGEEANVKGVSHGRALTRRLPDGGTLVVVSDNDVFDNFDSLVFRLQLVGLIVTALIAIGGAVGITVAIGARMRAMQRTVDAVIAGDLHSRVPLDGSRSEFDRLAAAFNRMLDRIDELMGNIRHAAKDVAHELKSPLARLRARIAATARHADGNPLAPDIADALDQTDRILDLFSSLMRLWEIEGGHRRDRFVDTDLSVLAREVGEVLGTVGEDAGHPLTLRTPSAVPIRGDVNLLRQMIVNLIENAIRHTPPGTAITVETGIDGDCARLIVADTGPGIPAADRTAVIRRFGRLEATGEVTGQGLGLTLVDAIARLHDGRFTLGDAGPGLLATVALPRR